MLALGTEAKYNEDHYRNILSGIRLCLVGDVLVTRKKDELHGSSRHPDCRVRIWNSDAGLKHNKEDTSRVFNVLVANTISYSAD